jgi:gamma-glutamylcyclotransferase
VVQSLDPTHNVLGVLYEISIDEKPALDKAEALGVGYAEKEVQVEVGDTNMRAWVYHALQIDPEAVPYDWYKALVVAGAKEHGLEASYVHRLEAAVSKPDQDSLRSARHFTLANDA